MTQECPHGHENNCARCHHKPSLGVLLDRAAQEHFDDLLNRCNGDRVFKTERGAYYSKTCDKHRECKEGPDRVTQENVDPNEVPCPFCGTVADLCDEDGISRERDESECQSCGAWVEITKFNVTVEWRKP